MKYARIGKYKIYEDGRIFMIGIHQMNFLTGKHKPREIIPSINKDGYKVITLKIDGKPYCYLVHRLIARLFIQNPLKKEQVNHKDGNKSNNSVSNLEWCTPYENLKHAGECLGKVLIKLTPDQIREIWHKTNIEHQRNKDVAVEYGVSPSRVSNIRNKSKESVDKYR